MNKVRFIRDTKEKSIGTIVYQTKSFIDIRDVFNNVYYQVLPEDIIEVLTIRLYKVTYETIYYDMRMPYHETYISRYDELWGYAKNPIVKDKYFKKLVIEINLDNGLDTTIVEVYNEGPD